MKYCKIDILLEKAQRSLIKADSCEALLCIEILKYADFSDYDKVLHHDDYLHRNLSDNPKSAEQYKDSLSIIFQDSNGYVFCDCEYRNIKVSEIIDIIKIKGHVTFNDFYNSTF